MMMLFIGIHKGTTSTLEPTSQISFLSSSVEGEIAPSLHRTAIIDIQDVGSDGILYVIARMRKEFFVIL